MYDVVIIGSGPAGLSAAIYASRAMMKMVVIERAGMSGGQIVNSEQVDNYLGMYGVSGFDMSMTFRAHADALGVPFLEGEVVGVIPEGENYRVELADGSSLETKAVIIATGAQHRKLGAAGEQDFAGKGVSYCATCDGAFFRKRSVVVVGGGNTALADAVYLSKLCEKVYLVHRRKEFRAAKWLWERIEEQENIIFLPECEVTEIAGSFKVESVQVRNRVTGEEQRIEAAGVFVAVGMEPATECFRELEILDEYGYVKAGEDCRTGRKRLYAAGDVRIKEARQIATAVGDGAAVIKSLETDLAE